MADKKISQLTGATTPLAGTEVLPIVQSGSTVKVAVSDLTAGRAITASGATISGLTASKTVFTDASKALTSSGTVGVDQGGTGTSTAFTAGSVVFAGASGVYSQSNANLFWDNSNSRLGIKTATPGYALDVVDNGTGVQGRISSSSSNGTSFAMTNSAANGRTWRIGNNYVIGNGEWSLYDDTASKEVLRADSSQNVRAVQGNFIVGTAGKGIDFSSNTHAAGMTSELLNWYEEGTWTPSVRGETGGAWSGQTGTFTGTYTRIGRMVTCNFSISLTATGSVAGNYAVIAGLPFTAGSPSGNAVISYWGPLTSNWTNIVGLASSTIIYLYGRKTAGTTQDVVFVSEITATTELLGTAIYFV